MDPSNRRDWDDVHRRRAEAASVAAEIPQRVRDRLPPLAGLRVLHLLCATGASTVELAEAGALVTGLDGSEEALAEARERSPELPWVHGDPHSLPGELRRGRFDLVYVDPGSLAFLTDLESFLGGVFAALRPLGWLVVYEEHPASACLDAALHWREDYFDPERRWRLGDVVTAVSQAGLHVRRLEEYPPRSDAWRRQDPRVPGEYLLRAEKPSTEGTT